MAIPFGCLISFVLPPFMIGDADADEEGREHVEFFLGI